MPHQKDKCGRVGFRGQKDGFKKGIHQHERNQGFKLKPEAYTLVIIVALIASTIAGVLLVAPLVVFIVKLSFVILLVVRRE